jgi:hypothetical protein
MAIRGISRRALNVHNVLSEIASACAASRGVSNIAGVVIGVLIS